MRFLLLSTTLIVIAARSIGDPIVVPRQIKWNAKPITLFYPGDKQVKALNFTGAHYDPAHGVIPFFNEHYRINEKGALTAQITNAVYAPVTNKSLIESGIKLIGTTIAVKAEEQYYKAQPYAFISFIPFIRNVATGQIEQLTSFNIEINVSPLKAGQKTGTRGSGRSVTWATSSVLANGAWYEFGINADGVYKLDASFFKSIGINIANINPQTFRLFGNGGGMLPEDNSVFRYDDLQENAIYYSGGSSTTFGANDYFLFFGQSPNQWYYNGTTFYHQVHIYSNYTYYFITTNYNVGTPKRITQQNFSNLTPNKTVTTFNDYQYHESDLVNLISSGREWMGESFEYTNPYSPSPFIFPNAVSSSTATLTSSVEASAIGSGDPSSFTVTVNGSTLTQPVLGVTGAFGAVYANNTTSSVSFTPSSSISVNVTYNQNSSSDLGWLYYLELNVRRNLQMYGDQMEFRDINSLGHGNIAQFQLGNASSNITVWDITTPITVAQQVTQLNGSTLQFNVPVDTTLHQFIAFDGQSFLSPATLIGSVANQNLHGLSNTDLVIVTAPEFASQATELANYHQSHDNISSQVVDENLIFNEFSSGAPDIVAIRDFMRMFYDRANGDTTKMPKYLLLFGDGSYDPKNRIPNNTNYILAYETPNSTDPLNSTTSDDFFGLLDSTVSSDFVDGDYMLDLSVGRIPADNTQEASQEVSKIIQYETPQGFGSWRNSLTFLTDASSDGGYDFEQASDGICDGIITPDYPVYNIDRIYLDAYPQVTSPGGTSYPGANTALYNQIYSGTLMIDYNGHGSQVQLSASDVLTIADINSWTNATKLPLFVTATCQFTEFDDDAQEQCAGALMLLKSNGGAIALVSTVRQCYLEENSVINADFNRHIFQPINGHMPYLGDAFLYAKNDYINSNTRRFGLFGDPCLRLAYPEFNVQTTAINNRAVTSTPDTLKALGKVTISGIVTDGNGNKLSNFNGIIYPTIYDKPILYTTLGSDDMQVDTFSMQNSIIYNGTASVHNGAFTFTFVVPKDISYQYGFGKISYYADDAQNDANGYFKHFIVGGLSNTVGMDKNGPTMKLYMNNTSFVFGGITDPNPKLLVLLSDSFGINVTSNGIGHDITAVMDNNTQNTLDLNSFYQADLDNYQKGTVLYPYTDLADGLHTINVTAWDVYDKSSEGDIEFIVASSAQMALANVFNYPNPFTTHTEFMFDDNMPGQLLHVQIQIYSISAKLVKTITTDVESNGYHVSNINWNGLDDYGNPIGKGVYVYRIFVTTSGGLSANKFEKLVVLR
jgi:hypothetical protein